MTIDEAIEAAVERVLRRVLPELLAGNSDEWIAIRACGLPYSTIRRAIRAGEIEARRFGRELRVQRSSVDAWISKQPSRGHQRTTVTANAPEVDDEIAALLERGRLRSVKGGRR